MTNEELQDVVAAVIQALKTNGKTISQLTPVTTLADADSLEVSGGKKIAFGKLKEIIASAVVVTEETIKSWVAIESTDDLPEDPTPAEQEKAYVLADDSTLYVYVETGGDTLDGLYQSVNMKGMTGEKGDDGVSLGDVAIADNLTTDDASKVLSARQGVVLSNGLATKQDTINDLADIRQGAALGATAIQSETDPTVGEHIKAITQADIDKWDTAANIIEPVEDRVDVLTTETVIPYNKMEVSNGKLVLSTLTTGKRTILRFDIDENDNTLVYRLNQLQSPNGGLAYAFTDEEDNVIASKTGRTSNENYAVAQSLLNVRRIYVSMSNGSTSASINCVRWGDSDYVAQSDKVVYFSSALVSLGNYYLTVNDGKVGISSSAATKTSLMALICGQKSFEGVGYADSGKYNWIITDENLNVLESNIYPSYFNTVTPYRQLPEGARLIFYSDTQSATASNAKSKYVFYPTIKQEYKILVVGNSFTQCYWTYVPVILKHLFGNKYKFTIVVGMAGLSSFQQWYNWLSSGTCTTSISIGGTWVNYLTTTAANLFATFNNFDLFGFQERSDFSHDYDNWKNYWSPAITKLCKLNKAPFELMWTMVHSKPTSSAVESSDTVFNNVIAAHQSFASDFPVDICPVGTAIQNARHSSINDIEWEGSYGQLTADNQHLQNGFACFIAAWVVVEYIAKKLGINIPVYGDQLSANAELDATFNKLTTYGNVIYSTGEDMNIIAQKCIASALKFPFEIKTIN